MSQSGMLRVVSEEDLQAQAIEDTPEESQVEDHGVIGHIRERFEIMRNHRESSGLEQRLLRALRVFNGEYDSGTLSEIRKFGGSEVYSRLVGTKARSATALLRDVYFSGPKPWGIEPTDKPTLPDDIVSAIPKVVQAEIAQARAQGVEIPEEEIRARMNMLLAAAQQAARDKAQKAAESSEYEVNDFLQEGGFYEALGDILVDLPLFPFVVMKGPVVRMADKVTYKDGGVEVKQVPKLFWKRVSPFDFFWLPGAYSTAETEVCERLKWTRRDLNDLIGLPGWSETAVREAINDYDNGGLVDYTTSSDSERAIQEDREQPTWNRSGMIDAIEYHGTVQGKKLLLLGFSESQIPDPLREYSIEAWAVGRHLLKVMLNPSPRKRHPYFTTSFERVPGTPVGHSLPDMLSDIQDVANASMRNLVNNMSLASGPQVVIMQDQLSSMDDADELYPWKRWFMETDAYSANKTQPPVNFFQPKSNAGELLGIYQKMTEIADEVSAIPRYITGSGAPGGAGRTASGLSMLMNNASKVLQQVAHNVDQDIIGETLRALYDLIMVADTGATMRGDEQIVVRGVSRVMAKEAERARQLEFLSLTGNPIDMQIIGLEGRAEVLRAIADDLQLPSGKAVPSAEELQKRQAQALQAQQAQAQAQASGDGNPAPRPGGGDQQNTNTVQPNLNMRGN